MKKTNALEFRVYFNRTDRNIIDMDVCCSWNNKVVNIPFANMEVGRSFCIEACDRLYDRADAVVLGVSEVIDNRKVYSASTIVFLENLRPTVIHPLVLSDEANAGLVELTGGICCAQQIAFDHTTKSAKDVLTDYERGLALYQRDMTAFLSKFTLSNIELKDLDLTLHTNRNGKKYPGYAYTCVGRSDPISPRVLEYLLQMACFHADCTTDQFVKMAHHIANRVDDEWKIMLPVVMDIVTNACCIISNLLNYDFDYAMDRKGLKVLVERFSMIIPKIAQKGVGTDDCEELATLCALLCYYMKTAKIDGMESTYPLLSHIKPVLTDAFIADVLMLVEAPNVKESLSKKKAELMGHMASIVKPVINNTDFVELTLAPTAGDPSTCTLTMEGTGPTDNNLLQPDLETQRLQKQIDDRLQQTPLRCWTQRRNLTCKEVVLHNMDNSINGFYLILDQYFPIVSDIKEGRSYVSLNYKGQRGTAVPDILLPNSGAKMVMAPRFPEAYMSSLEQMMKYTFPENPLEIESLDQDSIERVAVLNNQLKKSALPLTNAYQFLSLTYDFDKIMECEWEFIIRWVAEQPDIAQADLRLFGKFCKVSVVILKLIFK